MKNYYNHKRYRKGNNYYYNNKNYQNDNNNNQNNYIIENKYDKSYNSLEKLSEQIFQPNEKFLLEKSEDENIPEKLEHLNINAQDYYPLPSNPAYESFLKVMKKEQYSKTQYSMPFMLSLRQKYTEKPFAMRDIKIPQKSEIRSRAKVVTEEAYRVTRNYLDENSDKRDFSIAYIKKNEMSEEELKKKTMILREILNKICYENYDTLLNELLKFEYEEKLLENFKNLLLTKMLTENQFFPIYIDICSQMCKLYNKKTYSNEPKMHFKNLLVLSLQKEFLNQKSTNIAFPFSFRNTEKSKDKFIKNIKYANIRIICEFYLNNLITQKVIKDCIDELIQTNNNFSIGLLCYLVTLLLKKLFTEVKELFDLAISYLESVSNKETLSVKAKFQVMEVLDLKEKILYQDTLSYTSLGDVTNSNASTSGGSQISNNCNNSYNNLKRKNSSFSVHRKSSINPKDVEYIKRSRFNSKADELKIQKEENPDLINEVLQYLGEDIDFYQCFQLNEEEFEIIKEYFNKFILLSTNINHNLKNEQIEQIFNDMMDEIQCEKFIAFGHLIEIMFSQDDSSCNIIIEVFIYLFNFKLINEEDIKHGIVLGLVNFKNNIIDYPFTKKYFQKLIDSIQSNKMLDKNIVKVYQKCCDNMDK